MTAWTELAQLVAGLAALVGVLFILGRTLWP